MWQQGTGMFQPKGSGLQQEWLQPAAGIGCAPRERIQAVSTFSDHIRYLRAHPTAGTATACGKAPLFPRLSFQLDTFSKW